MKKISRAGRAKRAKTVSKNAQSFDKKSATTDKRDDGSSEQAVAPSPKAERADNGASTVGRKAVTLSSQFIYTGKVFGIRRDEVIEPSGVRTTREMITHPGSVVVLPVLPDGRVLLIQQYRYAARQYLWELVAGRIDEGETPLQAAERELKEETGYRARRLKIFLELFPTPGFLEEKMFLLLAEGLTPGKATPEDDEKIISRAYKRKRIENMLQKKELRDAKTIAGLLYYFRFLVH
jgi:ADP-ribose diphosphatase